MSFNDQVSRRKFLKSSALLLGAATVPWGAGRAANAASNSRLAIASGPQLEQGIQIGDVRAHRAVIWSRSDRPSRMFVEYDFNSRFTNPIAVRGPFALETSDYVARVDLTGLPENSEVFVRVMFEDLSNENNLSGSGSGLLPHRAGQKSLYPLSVERRYRRPGMGDQPRLWRDENLRGHAPNPARLFYSLWGYNLRRWTY